MEAPEVTQDEIIEMAKQAGAIYSNDHAVSLLDDEIIIFAQLVAQHEREACAKECEHTALRMGSEWMAQHCAKAIRTRGQA